LAILDIGSGSGCIPVALKRRLGKASVWSCDISPEALAVAQRNAINLGVEVHFRELDFLDKRQREQLPSFDVIVSNPPYVPEKDKPEMRPNVLDYEPGTALFVPDDDPLVFYRAIADFGEKHLNAGGAIYMELHESLGIAAVELFRKNGYETELKKDMQEKERMLKTIYGL
jgi:release factor glutamine methyltransferase